MHMVGGFDDKYKSARVRPGPGVILVGFMATGKSAVGSLLAERMGLPFIDTDSLVEQQAQRSVSQVFRDEGEEGFRCRERCAIEQACAETPAVIATGGGVLLDSRNVTRLQKAGTLVLLQASPAEIYRRVRVATAADGRQVRPLLAVDDPLGEIRRLLEARRPYYQLADVCVDTTGLTPEGVADRVMEQVKSMNDGKSLVVTVQLSRTESSYDIHVGGGLLKRAGDLMVAATRASRGTRVLAVVDTNVASLYGEEVGRSLARAGLEVSWLEVPPGEETKSLSWAAAGYDAAVDHGLDRGSLVVALGGGVVGDLAGFIAATFLRGLRFVQLPTTLLAQVDSSVGGKVAVNLPQGKNLVGAFHQPAIVVADPRVLRTLPIREFRAGVAEVIKHGVIADAEYFDFLERNRIAILEQDSAVLSELLVRSCQIKASVVQADEREEGLRAMLNYGHTLGHAVEAVAGYGRYLHGEAVALGMVAAGKLAADRGLWAQEEAARVRQLLYAYGLPVDLPDLPTDRLVAALSRDKKRRQGQVKWVLPERIGRVTTGHVVSPGEVVELVESLKSEAYGNEHES